VLVLAKQQLVMKNKGALEQLMYQVTNVNNFFKTATSQVQLICQTYAIVESKSRKLHDSLQEIKV